MDRVSVGEVELCCERLGDEARTTVLLLAGHGAQMQWWDDVFCAALVDAGFAVVRFDNRDVGGSTWFEAAGRPDLGAILRGEPTDVPYTLWSMADDTVGLLDALEL